MKNRKRIVVLFLLVAVMFIGVGFAALTDQLTIIGDASIDIASAEKTFDSKVYFLDQVTKTSTGTGTKDDIASALDDSATFTVNKLAVVDEYSTFTYTIKNDSNVSVKITIEAKKLSGDNNQLNSNTDYFDVSYAFSDGGVIASKGTITVTVTVRVKKPVTTATSGTFSVELTATTVDA